jgi:hypothetical protein
MVRLAALRTGRARAVGLRAGSRPVLDSGARGQQTVGARAMMQQGGTAESQIKRLSTHGRTQSAGMIFPVSLPIMSRTS